MKSCKEFQFTDENMRMRNKQTYPRFLMKSDINKKDKCHESVIIMCFFFFFFLCSLVVLMEK